jgi:hypothetical protein
MGISSSPTLVREVCTNLTAAQARAWVSSYQQQEPVAWGGRHSCSLVQQEEDRRRCRAIQCPARGGLQNPGEKCRNANCGADIHELRSPLTGLRFHDLRDHAITELAESQASDQTIMSIAGHVSRKMLAHYSHVRLDAKRRALDALVGVR